MKIVVNKRYGGFGLSKEAREMLKDLVGDKFDLLNYYDKAWRTDKNLITVVETLGDNANSKFAELVVVKIPNKSTDWDLEEYDGLEDIIYVVDGKIHRK